MEIALLSEHALRMVEYANMALAVVAGIAALLLLLSVKGQLGISWQLVASGVLVFAVAELLGGLPIVGSAQSLGERFETVYLAIQCVFLALVLTGVVLQVRAIRQVAGRQR